MTREEAHGIFTDVANMFRMYPNLKHTFSDYWETIKDKQSTPIDLKWIKLSDRLPKTDQKVDLWIVPEDEEKSHRVSYTWKDGDTAELKINDKNAMYWISLDNESTPIDFNDKLTFETLPDKTNVITIKGKNIHGDDYIRQEVIEQMAVFDALKAKCKSTPIDWDGKLIILLDAYEKYIGQNFFSTINKEIFVKDWLKQQNLNPTILSTEIQQKDIDWDGQFEKFKSEFGLEGVSPYEAIREFIHYLKQQNLSTPVKEKSILDSIPEGYTEIVKIFENGLSGNTEKVQGYGLKFIAKYPHNKLSGAFGNIKNGIKSTVTLDSVPSVSSIPYKCPICLGNGIVSGGFYNTTSGMSITGDLSEPCRSCSGTGIIYSVPPVKEKTPRQYLYQFFELPFHKQIEKMLEYGLYEEGDSELGNKEATQKWSKKLIQSVTPKEQPNK